MISIIRYTLITALRDFLFIGLFGIVVLAMIIANFLGSTALSEQEQMIMTYMAGSSRFIVVVGLVLFVCFHVRRSFDNKEIEVILTKAISRKTFIFSYWLAFTILSLIITIPLVTFISIFTHADKIGLLYWGSSIMCEAIIIIAFAILSALILKSAVTSALSTLCFYFLSRMMGFFISSIHHPFNTNIPDSEHSIHWLSEWILMLVSTILPRLDLFGKTSWLVYGVKDLSEVVIFFTQSLVYIPLLLIVAIIDFNKKEF